MRGLTLAAAARAKRGQRGAGEPQNDHERRPSEDSRAAEDSRGQQRTAEDSRGQQRTAEGGYRTRVPELGRDRADRDGIALKSQIEPLP